MGILRDNMADFGTALDKVDAKLDAARPFDKKTDELLRFALSIKGRSAPCVRKHFKGSKAAGATDAEIGYVFALTMRESAGADECWTAGVLSELAAADDSGACG
ncbi:MAG: carboxymuconolactone decarboxylase family protein [Rhodobacteraceae bacterium]|nr:carboxymuconolactone decarboxylase family protein [Paracoccaceae bacterium]